MTSNAADTFVDLYERKVDRAREAFRARLAPMFGESDARVLGLFLINFCAQGVGMTEPVPGWIRRAGERTQKQGFEDLGSSLIKHAVHESGHHEMMIADTRSLVQWWNAHRSPIVDADRFLKQPLSPGVMRYRDLHEHYIESETPYCQIAIEYEIEKVSVDFGPKLIAFLAQRLGPEILQSLSFVTEHVAVDVGHTQYNKRALGSFLASAPQALDHLVQAGSQALDCYGSYVEDAMALAKEYLRENA